MKKLFWIVIIIGSFGISRLNAQTASFNFSLGAQTVSGWTNVAGDPSTGVRTATDAATGIHISSVATGNWAAYNGGAAFDGGGQSGGTFFPSAVMLNFWFQYSAFYGAYNAAVPQLEITGLNIDSVYTLKMTTSFSGAQVPNTFNLNPVQYTVAGTSVYGFVDVNGNFNTANGAVFNNIAPDASGMIRVYVNTLSTTDVAGISGLQITPGRTSAPVPSVTITNPINGSVLPEDVSLGIGANASETNGTIARVEFYADTTLIGVDSTAPYTMTWVQPDPGGYTLTARAVDGLGNIGTSTITIGIQSMNTYWSTTGNVGNNGDSNFVGNVDSIRLGFRTKNMERMSISPTGNVGIGVTAPTAQLHTTGSVRFSGILSDSSKTRILVCDSGGNVYYRNMSTLGAVGNWQSSGAAVYDSVDNIGIGTSNTQGYKLAVNGSAIFTRVKVKAESGWPDYVFGKGYPLPDLTQLASYITEHKHLPGITPAALVAHEGIDIGVQQMALLKKVEELTLYLIDENKKLKDQNRRLEEQNKQLQTQQQEIEELKKMIESKK